MYDARCSTHFTPSNVWKNLRNLLCTGDQVQKQGNLPCLWSPGSGGSRIFPRGCANSQIGIILQFFCQNLHENERIWTPGGGARPWHPPQIRQCKAVADPGFSKWGGAVLSQMGGVHILFSGKKCMKLKEIGLKWGGARLLAPCYSKITIFLWIILNSIMKTSYFTYFENNLLKRPPGSLGAMVLLQNCSFDT